MTVTEIANSVTALLRAGKFHDVYEQYYDTEVVRHIEPKSPFFPDLTGVNALKEKDAKIQPNIASVDTLEIGEPIISKSFFALTFKMSATLKDGNQNRLDEIIVYEVQKGKIVLEQFFY
ncbi:MAG: hypothetical protein HC880_04485 [Bacteroidia bacterium]|nr:hypothetical protein [Bacteroidia bacterium]